MAKNNKQVAGQDSNSTKETNRRKQGFAYRETRKHDFGMANQTAQTVTDIEHFDISCWWPWLPGSISFATLKRTKATRWYIMEPTAIWNCVPAWFQDFGLGLQTYQAVKKWFGGRAYSIRWTYTSVYLSYRDERCVKDSSAQTTRTYEQLAKIALTRTILKKSAYARIGSFLK